MSWEQSLLIEEDAPLSLHHLAMRICEVSNFRFAWQWYRCDSRVLTTAANVRRVLSTILTVPEYHRFLQESFEEWLHDQVEIDQFEIVSLHKHCELVSAEGEFENVLGRIANNHEGAYSSLTERATSAEIDQIRGLFGSLGDYLAFDLVPGSEPSCPNCKDRNNHLFTNWFYGVAWDWCFLLTWPADGRVWLDCLTDTD